MHACMRALVEEATRTSQPRGPQEKAKQATKRQMQVSMPLPIEGGMEPFLKFTAAMVPVPICIPNITTPAT